MEIPFKSLCHYDFRMVLIVLNAVLPLGPRVKFNGVTVQMKPFQQYFHIVLFVFAHFRNEFFTWATSGNEMVKSFSPLLFFSFFFLVF